MSVLTENLLADVQSILTTEAAFLAFLKPKQIGGTTDTLRLIQKNAAGTGIAVAVSDDSLQFLLAGVQTATGNKTYTGTADFQNQVRHSVDVTMDQNSSLIFKDGEILNTNRITNQDNFLGMFAWDDDYVTDTAPAINTTNWDNVTDFVLSSGFATYTHNTGNGYISFSMANTSTPRAQWLKFTYTISDVTGSADSFFISVGQYTKQMPTTVGTHSFYIFSINNAGGDFQVGAFSTSAGSFKISDIKVEGSVQQLLLPQAMRIGSVFIGSVNSDDQFKRTTYIQVGEGSAEATAQLNIFTGDSNQEFSMLFDEQDHRITNTWETRFYAETMLGGGSSLLFQDSDELTSASITNTGNNLVIDDIGLLTVNASNGLKITSGGLRLTAGDITLESGGDLVLEFASVAKGDLFGGSTGLNLRALSGKLFLKTASGDIELTPTSGTTKVTASGFEVVAGGMIVTAGLTQLKAGLTVTNVTTILTVGTATVAPLTFLSGALLTTAAAGVLEFDGVTFYATNVASSRGVIAIEKFQLLTSDYTLTNDAMAQKVFNATTNGAYTIGSATTLEFEATYIITNTGTTSHTWSVLFAGTATVTELQYVVRAHTSTGDILSATNEIYATQSAFSLPSTALAVTAASTSATENVIITITGTIAINVGGTIIPQIKLSAGTGGTAKILKGSKIVFRPIGSNVVTNVGNWS